MSEPGSPIKRKSPETVAATTETETKARAVCPDQVPFLKWYQVIRKTLFENGDGVPINYNGLQSNVQAIFTGLKRDMDSLTSYVNEYQNRRFCSEIHRNLFRQNVTNVRDKIKSIWVALFGQSSSDLDAVDAELYDLLSRL
jgi:hypothetical protein